MARFYPEVYDLQPWYHDFTRLGLQTRFPMRRKDQLRLLLTPIRRLLGHGYVEKGERFSVRQFLRPAIPPHPVNQQRKEAYIVPYVQRCLQEMASHPAMRCLDLFCADGYYTSLIAQLCPGAVMTGVDLDGDEIRRAKTAARLLGVKQSQFVQADVWDFTRNAQAYELVLCTGGLYHLTDPQGFTRLLRMTGSRYLVVQSVVTMETDDPDYFVSPAPGWKHGSRFTHVGLGRWLEASGWHILESAVNELSGNQRMCDRGSSYYRCIAV
ncbi:MAG: class I SAM-dependent methyltransferase [Chloroflexi bacterium]|nr:class I SAM-dependent methyltransferase [Chloroflexota bacterium]